MDTNWVRIRSWHAVHDTSRFGIRMTRCGRIAPLGAERSDTLPAGKSCETCLRIVARAADR